MKVAFSTWNGRISPVFDVSAQLCLVEINDGQGLDREYKKLPQGTDRCAWLVREGAEVLVCGAISNKIQSRLEWMNIRVFPFVTGEIEEVIQAWMGDSLKSESFAMPGCCRRLGESLKNMEVIYMRGRNKGQNCPRGRGQGQGAGRGMGQGAGQGQSSGSGQAAGSSSAPGQGAGFGGQSGQCICPGCGHEEPHQRGVPCMETKCPECGQTMRGKA